MTDSCDDDFPFCFVWEMAERKVRTKRIRGRRKKRKRDGKERNEETSETKVEEE